MPLISFSVDELRRAASSVEDVVVDLDPLPLLSVAGQPDLSLALADFTGCLNDCRSERLRDIETLATGLRAVAEMFESRENSVVDDIRALFSTVDWSIR